MNMILCIRDRIRGQIFYLLPFYSIVSINLAIEIQSDKHATRGAVVTKGLTKFKRSHDAQPPAGMKSTERVSSKTQDWFYELLTFISF